MAILTMRTFAFAQEKDIEGIRDHPMLNRMTGFYIIDYLEEDFGSYEFYYLDNYKIVEGKKTYIVYESEKDVGALKIVRNFSNAVKKIGGEVFEDEDKRVVLIIRKGNSEIWAELFSYSNSYSLVIIEKGKVEQEITANSILKEINETGKAVLYINFDSGKSTIKKELQQL